MINLKNGQGGLWLNEIWTALAHRVVLRLKEFGILLSDGNEGSLSARDP